jgi:hypothetical protein
MSVFDDLGVLGKPALPSFLKFQTCKNASSGLRDTVLRTEATGVFFHDGGLFSDQDSGLIGEVLDDSRVTHCS